MTVDKELLFKPRLPEADVELEGFGVVRVRGLSRSEVLAIQKIAGSGTDVLERKMLAAALVDPRMTEGEVRQWQDAAPAGELEPITDKVQELSGVSSGAAKEVYRAFEENPETEFRALPSDQAEHDRGGAPAPDASG